MDRQPETIWEYLVDSAGTEQQEIDNALENAGSKGWELVSVIVVEATRNEWRTRLIFKRPFTG